MGKIFDYEGPLFTSLSRFADLIWLNFLYVICCIPIITIGASTTALYYVTLKMAKDEEGYITKSFFKSFKDNLKQSIGIWMIFLIVIVVLICDLYIANGGSLATILQSEAISSVVLVAVGVMAIILTMTLTYVFPLLAKFDNTVKNTIKNAFLISIRHLPYTILLIAINIVPWVVIFWIGNMTILLVFVIFSAQAYFCSKVFVKIFVHYLPKEGEDSAVDETVGTDEAMGVESSESEANTDATLAVSEDSVIETEE